MKSLSRIRKFHAGRMLLMLLAFVPLSLAAQDDEEYRMEIGGGLGTDFYLGDVSSTPFRKPGVAAALLWRRNFNPRMGLKANLAMAHLRGASGKRFIPADASTPGAEGGVPVAVDFKRGVIDLGAQYELNFFGYGLGKEYMNMRRFTPYITIGVGFTLAVGGGESAAFGLNIPVGLGVKYKLKPRLNVGAEWSFRMTTTDELDAGGQATLAHPYNIKGKGFKNKDAYSLLMLTLTYDISPKCKTCHNND